MNCIKITTQWTIYNAKNKEFTYFTHEEFKDFLIDNTDVELNGRFIDVNSMEKIWIDAMLNKVWFMDGVVITEKMDGINYRKNIGKYYENKMD